jgi:carboxyl-terminal processing protease
MAQPYVDKGIILLIMTASFLTGYLFRITLPWSEEDMSAGLSTSQEDEYAMHRYTEAMRYIEERAIFSIPVKSSQDIVTSSLKAYLAQQDPYSDFLSPEEFVEFRAAGSHRHAGIGLDIEKRRDGSVICYPLPNGPSALAGIMPGDRLLAVDGISVQGKSLPTIIALAAGRVGTEVVVEIKSLSATNRQVTITRSMLAAPALSQYIFRSTRIIKLSYFTPDTKSDLYDLLSDWRKSDPIIIDLRGSGGGDFYAAVDSAMLFLMQGDAIVSVSGRTGVQAYASTLPKQSFTQQVFLWQDEFTASAAEIFIAALIENGRGTSVGRTTAGKGTRQDIIELQDGSALVLTTGYLSTPRSVQFDGRGLSPMHQIEAGMSTTETFFDKTATLTHRVGQ